MIWLGFAILSLIILSPVIWAQRGTVMLGRRESALALYRAQLKDVAEDGARGRFQPREQAEAKLEIERRLLAAGGLAEETITGRSGFSCRLAMLVLVIPILALALYLPQGAPLLPAAPLAPRIQAAQAQMMQDRAMLGMLQAKIATLDPKSDQARQGFVLLGNLEANLGDASAAADAWGRALAIRYDAKLAKLQAMAEAVAKQSTQSGAASP
ncbi:c-type cytochrome biogenesis protein CcmI [Acidisoma cellulosilytica]|uniref:C-type cytochrome biogenesis protein CcmI n=1 Tax=Acidisoma cellulosilyticum TaxID=2802395 RepID=A0A963YYD2_9PROT|nr:c-type cytochrome biogenesis protein CcmI [Acidisoma cellulosilyticum]MCB8879101.1 c-type cytochrome biogenesis protein CcmI [Acidisoma cellulosilyticum]